MDKELLDAEVENQGRVPQFADSNIYQMQEIENGQIMNGQGQYN